MIIMLGAFLLVSACVTVPPKKPIPIVKKPIPKPDPIRRIDHLQQANEFVWQLNHALEVKKLRLSAAIRMAALLRGNLKKLRRWKSRRVFRRKWIAKHLGQCLNQGPTLARGTSLDGPFPGALKRPTSRQDVRAQFDKWNTAALEKMEPCKGKAVVLKRRKKLRKRNRSIAHKLLKLVHRLRVLTQIDRVASPARLARFSQRANTLRRELATFEKTVLRSSFNDPDLSKAVKRMAKKKARQTKKLRRLLKLKMARLRSETRRAQRLMEKKLLAIDRVLRRFRR